MRETGEICGKKAIRLQVNQVSIKKVMFVAD